MKILILGSFSLLVFLFSTLADVTIVQDNETNGGMMRAWTNRSTLKIKGTKIRMDTVGSSTISDSESGVQITLLHGQKRYMTVNHSDSQRKEALEWTEKGLNWDGNASGTSSTPNSTGKKQKINGFETEQFLWESPRGKFTFWITKDFPSATQDPKPRETITKSFSQAQAGAAGFFPGPLPGLPIRTESEFPIPKPVGLTAQQLKQGGFVEGQSMKAISTVVSVSEASIDDSEFQIPPGYTELRSAPNSINLPSNSFRKSDPTKSSDKPIRK